MPLCLVTVPAVPLGPYLPPLALVVAGYRLPPLLFLEPLSFCLPALLVALGNEALYLSLRRL